MMAIITSIYLDNIWDNTCVWDIELIYPKKNFEVMPKVG